MGEYLTADRDNALAGGVFNSRNLQTYHYAGNNPIKYTDPTGESIATKTMGPIARLTYMYATGNWLPPSDTNSRFNQAAILGGITAYGGPVTKILYGSALAGQLPRGGVIDNNHPTVGKILTSALSDSGNQLNQEIINQVSSNISENAGGFGDWGDSASGTDLSYALGSVDYSYTTKQDDKGNTIISVTVTDTWDFDRKPAGERTTNAEALTAVGRNANIIDNSRPPTISITYTITIDANGNVVEPQE